MKISKILLVDDEKHVRRIAEISLSTVDEWQVVVAGSGLEALEKAQSEQPDLILLDVKMPDMDGITTVKKLREIEETAKIPVILLTGSTSEREFEPELGILGVIFKPYNAVTLPAEIKDLTDKI